MKRVIWTSLITLVLLGATSFAKDGTGIKTKEMQGTTQQERVRSMNQEREQLEDKNEDGESQRMHQNQIKEMNKVQQMNQIEQMNQVRTLQQKMKMGKPEGSNPSK